MTGVLDVLDELKRCGALKRVVEDVAWVDCEAWVDWVSRVVLRPKLELEYWLA